MTQICVYLNLQHEFKRMLTSTLVQPRTELRCMLKEVSCASCGCWDQLPSVLDMLGEDTYGLKEEQGNKCGSGGRLQAQHIDSGCTESIVR